MDFWALRCLEEVREAEEAGVPPPGAVINDVTLHYIKSHVIHITSHYISSHY